MAQSRKNSPKYVYDIPYFERMELCRILDQNDKWEELGGVHMDFDVLTIQTLRREILRGNSPTDELLTKWGHQNHTILELFVLLSKMQHYQAMLIIKQFVDSEYHKLIYEGEQNLNRLFKSKQNSNSVNSNLLNEKGSQLQAIGNQNLDVGTSEKKIINGLDPSPSIRKEIRTSCNNNNNNSNNHNNHNNNRNNAQTALINRATLTSEPGVNNQASSKFLKPDTNKDKNVSEVSSIAESVGILPLITFKELELATNGWDQSMILGKGGFGTVYKGTWKNTSVAIKKTRNTEANENHSIQIQQILGELKMLNSYRHDNILPLYGFSMDGEDPCLIYQYLPNGSLEDRLLCRHGTKPLSWYQRLNIATGTARGIQFLHTIGEKPLIHGDIKSANILLDLNYEPKIGDFGLAREGPYNHYTHMKVSRVHGTRPYLPDEFLRHKKFSTKVDTYSFGVVLFELATGLRAYDDQRQHKFLKDHVENTALNQMGLLVDKKCGPDEQHTFSNLITLGKWCISRKPKDRPEMVVALQELNAMATKRDMLVKVQSMIKQNTLTPTTPFEMQVLHDHLSQQKKISPYSSNARNVIAPTRTVLPFQPSLYPEAQATDNATSIEAQPPIMSPASNFINVQNNPFLPLDKKSLQVKDQAVAGSSKDGEASAFADNNMRKTELQEKSKIQQISTPGLQCKAPVISVSPPTVSHSISISSEDTVSASPAPVTEDLDYELTSDVEKFLPLISVLGVKTKTEESSKSKKEEVQVRDSESPDVNTSAIGKPLWILHESG